MNNIEDFFFNERTNFDALEPPTNFTGSKHKIIHQLIANFPKEGTVATFYDAFAGGLSVTMNVKYSKIRSNDIIVPLIAFYEKLFVAATSNTVNDLIAKILSYKISDKETYLQIREQFNENKDPFLLFSLISSCVNNMMRFNQSMQFNQSYGNRSINHSTLDKLRKYCQSMKYKDIVFSSLDFDVFLSQFPPGKDDFVYLDPPYFGITQAGYNNYWSKEKEQRLYIVLEQLHKEGVRFALSGVSENNGKINPFFDELKKYNIIELCHDYDHVSKYKNKKSTQEILVTNY